jgi:hypothetical protein
MICPLHHRDVIKQEKPDARILLLLPKKYLQREIPNHTCAAARKTRLSEDDMALIDSWRESGLLYECPSSMYDDW